MDDANIFETAAKKLGKKKPSKDLPSPPQPIGDKDIVKKRESKESLIPNMPKDPEILAMMEQMRTMQQDLNNKFEQLYRTSNMTSEQLQTFLSTRSNFSDADWDFVQKNRHLLEQKVVNTLGLELAPVKKSPRQAVHVRENKAGERKGKTLGARKKWIPMK